MKAEAIPDDLEDAEHAADAKALAELDAGRFVSGEAVLRWVRSWGRPDQLPRPQVGD